MSKKLKDYIAKYLLSDIEAYSLQTKAAGKIFAYLKSLILAMCNVLPMESENGFSV